MAFMGKHWKNFKRVAKRFHLIVATVVLLGLMFIFWMGSLLLEDYILSRVKQANAEHHWDWYTRFIYIVTTYPVRSAIVIACCVLVVSELHLRAKSHPLWKAAFGNDQTPNEVLGMDAESTTQKRVNVDLTPTQVQAPHQFLTVTNLDRKQTFHAQCRILEQRNDDNPQHRTLLDLGWWNRSEREIILGTGDSCKFLIAEAGDIADKDGWVTEWIKIVGIGESIESRFPRGSVAPPEYDIEVSIFGDASEKGYTAHFTVKPGTSYTIEIIRKVEEIWEPDGEGGPRILLHWDYPPDVAHGATPRKILMIENSNKNEDAFDIRLDEICLGQIRRISASMKHIQRISSGQYARADIVLTGKVPEGHQGELEMVFFAAEPLRREFTGINKDGAQFIRFPMVVTFTDYSKTRYRAHFEFTDNLDGWVPQQQISFIRREKLTATRPV